MILECNPACFLPNLVEMISLCSFLSSDGFLDRRISSLGYNNQETSFFVSSFKVIVLLLDVLQLHFGACIDELGKVRSIYI